MQKADTLAATGRLYEKHARWLKEGRMKKFPCAWFPWAGLKK